MKRFAFALLALSLSGCVSVLPKAGPAPSTFRMDAPAWSFESSAKVDWTIAVARPSAPRTLTGADLTLLESGNRVAYIANAEWAEPVPGLLQRTLAAGLDRSGKIIAASSESGARADCELQWDLYAFDAQQGAGGFSARFEAGVRLLDGRTRVIMRSTQIATTGKASGGSARAAADALTQAALAGLEQTGNWALAQRCEKRTALYRVRPGPIETPLAGTPSLLPMPGRRPAASAPPPPPLAQ